MRVGRALSAVVFVAIGVACVGDDPGTATVPSNDGGTSSSGGSSSGGSSGTDGSTGCSAADDRCSDANTLEKCKSDGTALEKTTCALGCGTAPSPHCKDIVPSAPVATSDLDAANLAAVTIATDAELDSETGAITGSAPRTANANPDTREIIGGIAMRLEPITSTAKKLAIFSVAAFTVNAGARLTLRGSNPVAIVSAGDVKITGVVDAQGTCLNGVGGPGGGAGGTSAVAAIGDGAGTTGATNSSYDTQGGAGGGYGDRGGKTSASGLQAGLGGASYGSEGIVPLLAGSGGGGGGTNNNATSGRGGGGGGAFMLVSRGTVIIGDGAAIAGINAGGCGGGGAQVITGSSAAGGGGGGSGGAVLVEAVALEIRQNGAIAANGGGGGAGSNTTLGSNPGTGGWLSKIGGDGATVGGGCGNGGRGGSVNDNTATTTTIGANPPANALGCGGGGGGGAGRLRFNTLSGQVTFTGNGFTSPRIAVDLNFNGSKLATSAPLTTQ